MHTFLTKQPLIKKHSLVTSTIDVIRQLISQGTWQVGDQIPPEATLAEEFGVGRNTIREAIKVLSYSGLLEVRQGSGTYVKRANDPAKTMLLLNQSGLKDQLEMQALLEAEAARYAAQRRTNEDIANLQKLIKERGEYQTGENIEDFFERDRNFHMAVITAAHNEALQALYSYFSDHVYQHIKILFNAHQYEEPALQLHTTLMNAIIEQDQQTAVETAQQLISTLINKMSAL